MFESIGYWRADCTSDEADDDEESAGDTGVGFGEAMRSKDLVQQRGDAVEETDVDAEGKEDEPELESAEQDQRAASEWRALDFGGRARRCWRCGRDEKGWDACNTRLYRNLLAFR
jgi:hypothetical protein